MVIIAIPTSKNGGLNDKLDEHFGKCTSLTFIEIIKNTIKSVKTIPNTLIVSSNGPGVQVVRKIKNNDADYVITKKIGINAAKNLHIFDIKLLQAPKKGMLIKTLVKLFIDGQLKEIELSNIQSHQIK